jgi:hypothetical protein
MHSSRLLPLGLLAGLVVAGAAPAAPKEPPTVNWADCVPPTFRWLGDVEFFQMLTAILKGDPPDAGFGWFHPGQSRYGWDWLAARFDANHDGVITREEFRGPAEFFDRIDRDHDGRLTPKDFDWSDDSSFMQQWGMAYGFFRRSDANSDGRVTAAEWEALFKKAAKGKDFVTPDDLRDLLFPPPPPPPSGKGPPPGMPTPGVLLRGLLLGEVGSQFEGPSPGRMAPDFNLETQDGKERISLSDYRGKKPVVLIFGNFT